MCVALIIRGKTAPSLRQFEAMEACNQDGAGLAWVEDGRVCYSKGHTAKEIHQMVGELPRPIMVHFRFATAGGKTAALCHPFPLTRQVETSVVGYAGSVMMHNGHWGEWESYKSIVSDDENPLPEGPWSDTRLAAYAMVNYPKDLDTIASIVGGKLAIMNAKGKIRQWGRWDTLKDLPGVSFSNTYWQGYSKYLDTRDRWRSSGPYDYLSRSHTTPAASATGRTGTWDPERRVIVWSDGTEERPSVNRSGWDADEDTMPQPRNTYRNYDAWKRYQEDEQIRREHREWIRTWAEEEAKSLEDISREDTEVDVESACRSLLDEDVALSQAFLRSFRESD